MDMPPPIEPDKTPSNPSNDKSGPPAPAPAPEKSSEPDKGKNDPLAPTPEVGKTPEPDKSGSVGLFAATISKIEKSGPPTPEAAQQSQAGKPESKIEHIESIRNHKVKQAHDMPGPDGSSQRQALTNETYKKEHADALKARADKFVEKNKEPLVTSKDTTREEGATKGRLSEEHQKARENDLGR